MLEIVFIIKKILIRIVVYVMNGIFIAPSRHFRPINRTAACFLQRINYVIVEYFHILISLYNSILSPFKSTFFWKYFFKCRFYP